MARWRWIDGYVDLYQVSDQGEVRSFRRADLRILKAQRNRTGYWYVNLSDGISPGSETRNIHALVMNAFVGPRPTGMVIRHLDDDRNNNALSNLAYGTHLENMEDVSRKKQSNNGKKRRCPYGHRYAGPNLTFTRAGGRVCKACAWTRNQARREGWYHEGPRSPRWRAASDVQYARIMKDFIDPEPDDPMPYGADPEVLVVTMTKGTLNAAMRALHKLVKDDRETDLVRGWFERSAKELWHAEMKAESKGYPHKWDGVLPAEKSDAPEEPAA